MFEILDFAINSVRGLRKNSSILKAATNWQPIIPQLLRSQGRVTKKELERKPKVTDTDVYGRAVRSSMGPGSMKAAKIFYRSPPEKPYVYKPMPRTAKAEELIAKTQKQAPIMFSGASGDNQR